MGKIKGLISIIVWNLLVNTIAKSILITPNVRFFLYKLAGMRIASSNIRSGCTFRGKSIEIEKGVFINHNVFIDAWEKVTIKENASIAFGVLICTSSHKIGGDDRRAGESDRRPVVIGRGCWIGARATILPGVRVGDGCVVASGAIVNKDCEPNSLYAGVPARKIKTI